jgi:hypothetical protein
MKPVKLPSGVMRPVAFSLNRPGGTAVEPCSWMGILSVMWKVNQWTAPRIVGDWLRVGIGYAYWDIRLGCKLTGCWDDELELDSEEGILVIRL